MPKPVQGRIDPNLPGISQAGSNEMYMTVPDFAGIEVSQGVLHNCVLSQVRRECRRQARITQTARRQPVASPPGAASGYGN